MKKIFTFVLALGMTITLVACNSSDNAPSSSNSTTPPPSQSNSEFATPPAAGTTEPNAQPTEINMADHISTAFAVSSENGMNQLLYAVHIFFSSVQPEIAHEDVTDIVMTQDGALISLNFNVVPANRPGDSGTLQTTYEIIFNPSFSVPTTGSGTYSFSCKILGIEFSTGEYYFDWDSGVPELTPSNTDTSQPPASFSENSLGAKLVEIGASHPHDAEFMDLNSEDYLISMRINGPTPDIKNEHPVYQIYTFGTDGTISMVEKRIFANAEDAQQLSGERFDNILYARTGVGPDTKQELLDRAKIWEQAGYAIYISGE